jgi:hypothetical protein
MGESAMNSQSSQQPIHIHIDEIIIQDIAVRDRDQLQAAMMDELTRLLTEQGIGALGTIGTASIAQLQGVPLPVQSNPRSSDLGTQIAQSIYGGFGNESGLSTQK